MAVIQRQNQDLVSDTVKRSLALIEAVANDMSSDAKQSSDLYMAGINTQLTRDVERLLTSPMESLLEFGTEINSTIQNTLHSYVVSYLGHRSDLIHQAFAVENNPLHFYLILKEDNRSTRHAINEFLGAYYTEEYSERFPVLFTYSTPDRIAKVEKLQKLEIDGKTS